MSAFCCNAPLVTYEKEVDVDRFMGNWYVIGVIPTPFEKDAYNPVERYSWNEKKKWVDVDFTFNKGSLNGEVSSVPQCLIVSGYPQAKVKPYIHLWISINRETLICMYVCLHSKGRKLDG
mmetsp:Transcript_23382/g.28822  ORF Transcript_23382/g.28822 Transcript_23382/m.28822 type:complete len:120 (-) Transcript_23382:550-909(-)